MSDTILGTIVWVVIGIGVYVYYTSEPAVIVTSCQIKHEQSHYEYIGKHYVQTPLAKLGVNNETQLRDFYTHSITVTNKSESGKITTKSLLSSVEYNQTKVITEYFTAAQTKTFKFKYPEVPLDVSNLSFRSQCVDS